MLENVAVLAQKENLLYISILAYSDLPPGHQLHHDISL